MRVIRILFISLLAIVLIGLALANRAPVTVKAFPANLDQYLGGSWQLTLPLFLILFLAILAGIVIGLIWEWLREAHIRSAAQRRANQLERLEREVNTLRHRHNVPRDDVLAIIDAPRPAPAGARAGSAARPVPAQPPLAPPPAGTAALPPR